MIPLGQTPACRRATASWCTKGVHQNSWIQTHHTVQRHGTNLRVVQGQHVLYTGRSVFQNDVRCGIQQCQPAVTAQNDS